MDITKYKRVKVLEQINKTHCIAECSGFKFKIRQNKIDAFVLEEVIFKSGYLKFLELNSNDIVADIGCNIGVFCVIAAGKVKHIYAYEPDKDNYELALENLRLNNITNVTIYNKAVMTDNKGAKLFLNGGVCTDCHSTFPINGRESVEVESVSLNEIITTHNINKCKVDCEGEELNFFQDGDFTRVDRIIAEVHFYISSKDKHSRWKKCLKNLKSHFKYIKLPPTIPDKFSRIIKASKTKFNIVKRETPKVTETKKPKQTKVVETKAKPQTTTKNSKDELSVNGIKVGQVVSFTNSKTKQVEKGVVVRLEKCHGRESYNAFVDVSGEKRKVSMNKVIKAKQ